MKKKVLFIVVIIIVLVFGILIYIGAFRSNNDIRIRVGYDTSLSCAPFMIAYKENIFDKYGVEIDLVPLQSSAQTQQALSMGKIDIGLTGMASVFVPISKKAPIKVIAPLSSALTRVFVRPDSGIEKLEDLVNKTIASRIGSTGNLVLRNILKREGIDTEGIKFIDIESTVRPMALMVKKIVDVAVSGENEDRLYWDSGAVLLKDWTDKGYTEESFLRTVIAVNSDFMKLNEKKAESFIDAIIDGHKFIKTNPDEAALIVSDYIKNETSGVVDYSINDIREQWKSTKYILWREPSYFVEIARISREIGDINEDLTLEQIFDSTFENKLEKAQYEIYGQNN